MWTQDAAWPFDFDPNDYGALRAALAASGLAPAEFYRRHLTELGPGGERRELPA